MTQSRLREIPTNQEQEWPQSQSRSPAPENNAAHQASLSLLILALKTLSQRTIVALAAIRAMILAGTVFYAAMAVIPEPTSAKLVALGLYAAFVLLLEGIFYRRTN